ITRTIEATTTTNGLFDGVISLGPACNVVISGTLHTRTPQVPDGLGTAFIEYHGSLNLANGRLLSDTGGNQIFCKCVDNNGDRVCDPPATCVQTPSGTGQATLTPPIVFMPIVTLPCQ